MDAGFVIYIIIVFLTLGIVWAVIKSFKMFMLVFFICILAVGYFNWIVAILMFKLWWTLAIIGVVIWFFGKIIKKLDS